eukprot:tig00022075_g23612.t1
MLAEVLFALVGKSGDVVRASRNAPLGDFPYLQESEREQLRRFAVLGAYYADLDAFICQRTRALSPSDGLYVRALAIGLDDVLDSYRATLLAFEQRVLHDPALSFSHLQHAVYEFDALLPALHSLVMQVTRDGDDGARVLSALHSHCNSGNAVVEAAMRRLQFHCHQVLFKFMGSWMMHGLLIDKHGEFFVQEPQPQSDGPSPQGPQGSQPTTAAGSRAWNSQCVLRLSLLPPYISIQTAEKILFVGKAVRVLHDQTYSREDALPAHVLREFEDVLIELQKASPFSSLLLEKAVERIRSVVAQRLRELVVDEAHLLRHLKAHKDYFLLARGDFYQAFIEDLNQLLLKLDMASPVEFDIRAVFQHSSSKSSAEEDPLFLNLFVNYQSVPSKTGTKCLAIDQWKGLGLGYNLEWPLHIVFNQDTLERYNTLFKFLFAVKRVQIDLEKTWPVQMTAAKGLSRKDVSLLVPVIKLRHEMSFVVDNLQYYMQVDVIEAQYAILQKKITEADDFEAVVRAHDEYLTTLLSQCFLNKKADVILRSLTTILEMCRKFAAMCTLVFRDTSTLDAPQLSQLTKNFEWHVCLLLRVLQGVQDLTSSPHLTQFLLRLDCNRFWSARAAAFSSTGKP